MSTLEINSIAKEKNEAVKINWRQNLTMDEATYRLEESPLHELLVRSFPADLLPSIYSKLKIVYESLRTQADADIKRNRFRKAKNLNDAFTWTGTHEGYVYWQALHDRTATARRLLRV